VSLLHRTRTQWWTDTCHLGLLRYGGGSSSAYVIIVLWVAFVSTIGKETLHRLSGFPSSSRRVCGILQYYSRLLFILLCILF